MAVRARRAHLGRGEALAYAHPLSPRPRRQLPSGLFVMPMGREDDGARGRGGTRSGGGRGRAPVHAPGAGRGTRARDGHLLIVEGLAGAVVAHGAHRGGDHGRHAPLSPEWPRRRAEGRARKTAFPRRSLLTRKCGEVHDRRASGHAGRSERLARPVTHRIPYASASWIRFEGLVVLIPPLSYSLPLRWMGYSVDQRRRPGARGPAAASIRAAPAPHNASRALSAPDHGRASAAGRAHKEVMRRYAGSGG